jgi:diguanylate cyclase (GGDEF)-like protein
MGTTGLMNPYLPLQSPDKLVYLVTNNSTFAQYVSQQTFHFGYKIQHVPDLKSLPALLSDQNSVAVLVDIPTDPGPNPENDVLIQITRYNPSNHHLIFLSEIDDQVVRLNALRAGGIAFFTKPLNIVNLIDKLDSLYRSTAAQQQAKVLIIEEQSPVASYYQMILKMSGIDAQIARSPRSVLEEMRDFHPDLILMNSFLPEINAADLARVIRQINDYLSIPIIFMSNEDDFGKRIEALDLGGEDFLIKPIKASHLMAVVRSRIDRSKILRSYMLRDSLTNLLNHTAFRNVLSHEVKRCQRQKAGLALAMLDIDNFKSVNDTYGHAVGDSAIKGLARLLQQRLRKSDLIGRYGGDEFVALLLDCSAEEAQKVMDEIRVHFSEIEFFPNQVRSLSLTFSCGISTYPNFLSAESLNDSADQALYIAKAGNRNKVVVALP